MTVVDLYAGPGGWDIAARRLGLDPIGIDLDPDVIATRRAGGLATIQADLSTYRPPPDLRVDGLIASPPCPAFSAATGAPGRRELPALIAAVRAGGSCPPGVSGPSRLLWAAWEWIRATRPTWIAMEQVRHVAPFWAAVAQALDDDGWSTWSGLLLAADFGVPQTRTRAILIGRRDRPVSPPPPTHARHPEPTLFGELAPWVSMAQALGWDGDFPDPGTPTVTGSAVARNWCWDRPATTVMGDARVWPPGHKINQADRDRLGAVEAERRYGDRAGSDAVKVTPEQAAALQTFPVGWPFAGNRESVARQIGNAVPPVLAAAVLSTVAPPIPIRYTGW